MRYKYWFILLAALLLTACSKDSDVTGGEPVPAPTPSNPTPSVPDVTESPLRLVAATRTLTDDVSPAGEAFDPIQFFLMSSENPESMTQSKIHKTEGEFTYDADATPLWSSNIGLKNASNCIYGFSPASAALATIAPMSEGTSYKNGAKITLTDISPVTGSDICVIVGVKHGKTAEETNVADMKHLGKFYFEKAPQNNYVSLLLDHLFAKISFSVNIDSEYHKMRSIKVKKIELLSDKTLTKVEVSLTANDTESGKDPIGTIDYTTAVVAGNADLPSGTIYDCTTDTDPDHSDGVELSEVKDSWIIPGYFAPGAEAAIGRHLSVRFTYDVYAYDVFNSNKKVRVREDCVSVNKLPAVTIGKEKADLKRGQSTTITLTVKPTYLYQLAEEELNNPTIVVGN